VLAFEGLLDALAGRTAVLQAEVAQEIHAFLTLAEADLQAAKNALGKT
jgi:hypothetical protein